MFVCFTFFCFFLSLRAIDPSKTDPRMCGNRQLMNTRVECHVICHSPCPSARAALLFAASTLLVGSNAKERDRESQHPTDRHSLSVPSRHHQTYIFCTQTNSQLLDRVKPYLDNSSTTGRINPFERRWNQPTHLPFFPLPFSFPPRRRKQTACHTTPPPCSVNSPRRSSRARELVRRGP